MNTIKVKIDITTAAGRKLVRELCKRKEVEFETPVQPEMMDETYSVKETFDELRTSLNEYYGVEE
ncbi:MAG: hypothetical protein LBH80_00705 [Prevotellaceae bacterium]|nr:hypothetical protein [Prevotellaceae bacterium]